MSAISAEFIDNFLFLPGLKSSFLDVYVKQVIFYSVSQIYKAGSQVVTPEFLLVATVGMQESSREKTPNFSSYQVEFILRVLDKSCFDLQKVQTVTKAKNRE